MSAAVVDRGLVVLKFGSSLLDGAEGFRRAGEEVRRVLRRGRRALVVVSATKGTTERLLTAAGELSGRAPQGQLALLLRTGEEASVALLAIALTELGVPVEPLTSEALRLSTRGPLDDAEPIGADLTRVCDLFTRCDVVIVPGFVGHDENGSPSLLGRGGSDLTALFLAAELGADEVRLVKDCDGVFSADPRHGPSERLRAASWGEVARVGGGVVQEKALRYARERSLVFRVVAPGGQGTLVGAEVAR